MGKRTRAADGAPVPRSWLPLVIAGGGFSGLSFITQTYIGEVQRPFRFAFLMFASLGSALILLPFVLKRRATRREVLAGVATGCMSALGLLLTLAAFAYLGSAIVLPFSVTTPVLLMLVIGHFVYREHLARPQLAGSLIGALAVLMLALGSR
jgi:drug/metabolite transporter (DMT)-like permease